MNNNLIRMKFTIISSVYKIQRHINVTKKYGNNQTFKKPNLVYFSFSGSKQINTSKKLIHIYIIIHYIRTIDIPEQGERLILCGSEVKALRVWVVEAGGGEGVDEPAKLRDL